MGFDTLNSINDSDVQQALTRSFGLRERIPCPSLAPELQPVVLVRDLTFAPPFDRQRLASGGGTVTSGALDPAQVELRNPAGSGVVARVAQVIISGGNTDVYKLYYADVSPTASLGVGVRHWTSNAIAGEPVCELAPASGGVLTNLFAQFRLVNQNQPFVWTFPVILFPGTALRISSTLLAFTMEFTFCWEEFLLVETR